MRTWPLWCLLAACTPRTDPDDTGDTGTDSGNDTHTGSDTGSSDTGDTGSGDTSSGDTGSGDTGTDTGDTGSGLDCQAQPPVVQAGTGHTTFVPLVDDGEVTLVKGPQNGYHIEGAVRVCNVPLPVLLTHRIRHEDTWTDLSGDLHYIVQDEDPSDPCCGVRTDVLGYVDTSDLPGGDTGTPDTLLDGEYVLITWEIDSTTWTGSDLKRAQVVWP